MEYLGFAMIGKENMRMYLRKSAQWLPVSGRAIGPIAKSLACPVKR